MFLPGDKTPTKPTRVAQYRREGNKGAVAIDDGAVGSLLRKRQLVLSPNTRQAKRKARQEAKEARLAALKARPVSLEQQRRTHESTRHV